MRVAWVRSPDSNRRAIRQNVGRIGRATRDFPVSRTTSGNGRLSRVGRGWLPSTTEGVLIIVEQGVNPIDHEVPEGWLLGEHATDVLGAKVGDVAEAEEGIADRICRVEDSARAT